MSQPHTTQTVNAGVITTSISLSEVTMQIGTGQPIILTREQADALADALMADTLSLDAMDKDRRYDAGQRLAPNEWPHEDDWNKR